MTAAILIFIALALLVLTAMVLLAAQGDVMRALKLFGLVIAGAVLGLAGLFALEWLGHAGGSVTVVVALFFVSALAIAFIPSGIEAVMNKSNTPAVVLAIIAGALVILGVPYLLGPGFAPLLGLLFFLLAAPFAGLSVLTARVPSNLGLVKILVVSLILGFLLLVGVVLFAAGDWAWIIFIGVAVALVLASLPQLIRFVRHPSFPDWEDILGPAATPRDRTRRRARLRAGSRPPSNLQRAWHSIRGLDRPDRRAR